MKELDHFVVANAARIPCTLRTLRPFRLEGGTTPWVHVGEVSDSLLYLASRVALPDDEIRALKELLERLSCLIKDLSDSPDRLQEETENTNGT